MHGKKNKTEKSKRLRKAPRRQTRGGGIVRRVKPANKFTYHFDHDNSAQSITYKKKRKQRN